jgi:general secretion pathway protein L
MMKWLKTAGTFLKRWTDNVAAAIISGFDRVVSPRVVRLIEDEAGGFTAESGGKSEMVSTRVQYSEGTLIAPNLATRFKGSRVEIVLQPKRFVFRPLEVPARAADFIEGIVRAQIDRLTPWSASEAVFGCSKPTKSDAESVSAVVAATTRKVAMRYVDAVSGFHPAEIAVLTDVAGYDVGRVKVFEQKARGYLDAARLSRMLLILFATTGLLALLSMTSAIWISDYLSNEEEELTRQIADRRAAIRANGDTGNHSPMTELERRKQRTPASVVVLDALTRALPDHTYVTELHLADNKLQIAGISGDAPSLISLIEQSQPFTRATFYAPTTRTPSDPGDRFHIEAQVKTKDAAKP